MKQSSIPIYQQLQKSSEGSGREKVDIRKMNMHITLIEAENQK